MHQTLATLQNLTAFIVGIGAGALGLESYHGFIFYLIFSLLTSTLVYMLRVRPERKSETIRVSETGIKRYFRSSRELWTDGIIESLSCFVLTWTLFYGLIRA